MAIRDSKDQGRGPVIHFSLAQWTGFVREALDGLPSINGVVTVTTTDTVTLVRCLTTDHTLRFTAAEWDAFLAGARDGEFKLPELPVLATS